MNSFYVKIVAGALAWTLLLGCGVFSLIHFAPDTGGVRPHDVEQAMADTATGSEGRERMAELVADTQAYVKAHPEAPAAMAQGKELAPADWLNEELANKGAKYRVRKVEGRFAELYDVS